MELATVECLVNLTAHSFLRLVTVLTYRKQTGYKVVFNCCSSAVILWCVLWVASYCHEYVLQLMKNVGVILAYVTACDILINGNFRNHINLVMFMY